MGRDRADLRSLGAFIRERRQQLGLTQTQLGRRIAYYQERISALERGTYGLPSLPALTELAQALECDLTDLLFACGYMETRTLEPSHGAAVTGSELRSRMERIHLGMDDLQRRLSATESAVHQMVGIQERMRSSRHQMNAGIRQCLESVS